MGHRASNSFTEADLRGLIGLAVTVASRYRRSQDGNFDEYVSAGLLAGAEALLTYDPTKGKLTTWATWRMRSHMSYLRYQEGRHAHASVDEYEEQFGDLEDIRPLPAAGESNWDYYFRHLTKRQKQVFELVFIKGLSRVEVARHLRVSKQNIDQIYHDGLRRLRTALADQKEELCAA